MSSKKAWLLLLSWMIWSCVGFKVLACVKIIGHGVWWLRSGTEVELGDHLLGMCRLVLAKGNGPGTKHTGFSDLRYCTQSRVLSTSLEGAVSFTWTGQVRDDTSPPVSTECKNRLCHLPASWSHFLWMFFFHIWGSNWMLSFLFVQPDFIKIFGIVSVILFYDNFFLVFTFFFALILL